jgi:hypothetical protein
MKETFGGHWEKMDGGYWGKRRGSVWASERLFGLQHGQVGKIRAVSGDHDFVFGKFFRIFEVDPDLLALLRTDRDHLFHPVVVEAQALDSYIILTFRYGGNVDAMCIVCGVNLVNDAGAGVIGTVENDQNGILVFFAGSNIVELELDASLVGGGNPGSSLGRSGLGVGLVSGQRGGGYQQANEVKGKLFHGVNIKLYTISTNAHASQQLIHLQSINTVYIFL